MLTMRFRLPFRHIDQDRQYYLEQSHLYVDDLGQLQEQRDKARTKDELQHYERLIEGAQRSLQYIQNKVER